MSLWTCYVDDVLVRHISFWIKSRDLNHFILACILLLHSYEQLETGGLPNRVLLCSVFVTMNHNSNVMKKKKI